MRLPFNERTKKIYIVTSDTGVENPIVKKYMHSSSKKINEFSRNICGNIHAEIIYPEVVQSFWSLVIGLGYPTTEPPGFRWCTEKLKIAPMNKFTNTIIEKYGEVIALHKQLNTPDLQETETLSPQRANAKCLKRKRLSLLCPTLRFRQCE